MRPRHWQRLKEIVGRDFDELSPEFTLDAITEMEFQNFAEQISDISNSATMELTIEIVSDCSFIRKLVPFHVPDEREFSSISGVESYQRHLAEDAFGNDPLQGSRYIQDKDHGRDSANIGGASSSIIGHEGDEVSFQFFKLTFFQRVRCSRGSQIRRAVRERGGLLGADPFDHRGGPGNNPDDSARLHVHGQHIHHGRHQETTPQGDGRLRQTDENVDRDYVTDGLHWPGLESHSRAAYVSFIFFLNFSESGYFE